MREKKTLEEVIEIARAEMEAANVRRAVVGAYVHPHSAYMRVRHAFGVEGTINVDVRIERVARDGAPQMRPAVTLNFPASNKTVIETVAFMHLINELTPLAASIQVQLDEYEIITEQPGPKKKCSCGAMNAGNHERGCPFYDGTPDALSTRPARKDIALLTDGQVAALAYVTRMYDEGAPAFNVDDKHGTSHLTIAARNKLEAMRLVERFDWATEYRMKHPDSALPPFIYFRPTQLGREYVTDARAAEPDVRNAGRIESDIIKARKASS